MRKQAVVKSQPGRKIRKKIADKMLRRKLTDEQAKRLMFISRFGEACKSGKIDDEMIHTFLEERRLAIISTKLPHATGGISKKVSPLSKMGLKDPVLDYFFGEHNKNLQITIDVLSKKESEAKSMIKPTKEISESLQKLRKCLVNIGTVTRKNGANFIVRLPNGQRMIIQSDVKNIKRGQNVLIHDGTIVDTATEKEFKKYSKFYKESLLKRSRKDR